MKNSLRVLTVSPVIILGMLTSLSMPVRAQGIPGAPIGAPSLPDVPGVDDLTPSSDSAAPDTTEEPSAEAPVEEPTATETAPTEEPTATEPAAAEEPTATEAAPVEEPTATEMAPEAAPTATESPVETPAATEVAPAEAPTATEAPVEAPTASEEPIEEAPAAATPTEGGETIVEIASSNESFSTLVAAIEAAGLKESLMADGSFTVFAPTNAAFEALPPGVLEKLLQPENKQVLTTVLTHHVLSDERMASDLSTESVTSLANSALQIKVDEAGVGIDNAKVLQADIDASNGVIHVIDKVLIPQELLKAPEPSSN